MEGARRPLPFSSTTFDESEKEGRGEVGRKGWAKILKVHRVYRAGNDLRRSSPSDLSKDTRNLRGASARASSESRSVYVSHLPSNQTGHRLLRSNILLLFYSQNFSRKIPSFIRFLSLYSVYRQGFSITGLHIKIMDLFIRTLFKKFLSRKGGYHLFHILFTDEISLRVIHKIRHEKIRSFLYFIYRQNFSCS